MAWRPAEYLEAGEIDNTNPGLVTGWIKFAGREEKITIVLQGNFHRDIRGAKIRFTGDALEAVDLDKARATLQGFATEQTGKAGDITAGLVPVDFVDYPYIEWYSDRNGRVVMELDPNQVEVIGMPIPAIESDPISREEQQQNMTDFLDNLLGNE